MPTISDVRHPMLVYDVNTLSLVLWDGAVTIDSGPGGGLTDAELRASAVPVSLASMPSTPVTGTFWQATQPVSGTVTANAGTNLNTSALALDASMTTLNTSVNTLLKPANTLAAVTSLTQFNGQAIALNTGVRSAGTLRVTVATDDVVPVTNANLDATISSRLKPADTLTGVTTVATVTNLAQMGAAAIAMNTGVRAAGVQRVTISTDDIVQNVGELAHDAVDSGNPQKIGGKAVSGLPTAVAALDRVNALFDAYGRFVTARSDTFAINHVPAAATQATIARASAGAGVKNVCTSITVTLSSAAAPTVGVVQFNLRDGASGAGTILWTAKLSLPAVAGQSETISMTDLWLVGSAATAMTLESAAAPAANVQATVSWTGTTTV